MKIINPIRVEVPMDPAPSYHWPTRHYYVEQGTSAIAVSIPDDAGLPSMFEWLSEQDALAQLLMLTPLIETCWTDKYLGGEWARVWQDAQAGNPYAQKALSKEFPQGPYRNAVWLFRDKAQAMLFKLRFGGTA